MTHSKRKGSGYEREIVSALQEAGLEAHKVPLSGAVKTAQGRYVADVLATIQGKDRRIECKRRKHALAFLVNNLEEADFLFIRPDRGTTTVSMSLETFLEIVT